MAILYEAVVFFLGGVSALMMMAMFVVSKRAEENEEEIIANLPSAMKSASWERDLARNSSISR